MVLDGWATLDSLTKKAETLKPGSEIVIKMTQEDLWKNLQWKLKDGSFFEYNHQKKQVIIYKPKKKNSSCAEEALDSWLSVQDAVDACSDSDDFVKKILSEWDKKIAQYHKQVAQKEQQVAQKEQQVAQKEQQVAKMERVSLMNPSRELRDMVVLYNKELDKKYIDVNKFYKKVKEAHKAILAPGSYIDSDTYKIFITDWAVKMIIWDLRRKLKQPYYNKYKGEINEIIRLLKEIDDKSKPKDYWLA